MSDLNLLKNIFNETYYVLIFNLGLFIIFNTKDLFAVAISGTATFMTTTLFCYF